MKGIIAVEAVEEIQIIGETILAFLNQTARAIRG